jgi:hypothetical protein
MVQDSRSASYPGAAIASSYDFGSIDFFPLCSVVRAACGLVPQCQCALCTGPDTCRACSKGGRCWPLFATVHSGWRGPFVHMARVTVTCCCIDSV